MSTHNDTSRNGNALTQREKEILSCIAQGLSSKQIAGQLSISPNTVANHRKNMLAKTASRNTYEMVSRNLNIIAD